MRWKPWTTAVRCSDHSSKWYCASAISALTYGNVRVRVDCRRHGTASPGLRSPGHRVNDFGRGGSNHGLLSHLVFDPVSSLNMHVNRGVTFTESHHWQTYIRGFSFGSPAPAFGQQSSI